MKKIIVSLLVAGVMLATNSMTTQAAYQLSSEVNTVTPALLAATQMGVQTHNTPELQQLPNKDAIVVMTFGTTFPETRANNIDATIQEIQKAHPNTKVVTAYTSHIIIDRVAKNEGIKFPTPEEAVVQLKEEGYTRVALATLDIIPGVEYNYKLGVFHNYKNQFKKMTIGTPLMYWQGQENQQDDVAEVLEAVKANLPKTNKSQAVLLMAHGTPHYANAYYAVIQGKLAEAGMDNVYVYTVEGWPRLEQVMKTLHQNKIKEVTLMPLMMVAGDHAQNDMAGEEEDSHKSILEKEGFKVNTYLHGLGENPAIRNIFAERANDSWNALQNK